MGYTGMPSMKIAKFLVAAGLLAALPLSVQAKIERRVEKTFNVQPGATLKVETQGGDVRVKPGTGDQVRVTAVQHIRTNSETEATELLQKLELVIEQQGSDVTASAKYAKRSAGFNFGSWPPVQVDFEVIVPAKFNVELKTSGGDIVVGNLTGTVSARTSGGDVKLGRIEGEVRAHTSGGDIELVQATGAADLHTSGGDIEVDAIVNTINASTSGGDVSAKFIGVLKGDCVLSTSGGDVEVVVDAAAGFQLEASTSGGEVEAEGLTITIERGGIGKSRLHGKVNGGGPLLKLRTSGGDIELKTSGKSS